MENELISKETEERIIADLKKLIENQQSGEIELKNYLNEKQEGGCMDFAMVCEASDDLRYFIDESRLRGVGIAVNEDTISLSV